MTPDQERRDDEPVPGHDADVPDSDSTDDAGVDIDVSDHEGDESEPGHDADVEAAGPPADRLREARNKMDRAEDADDDTRLEVLEEVRRALEAELDTSVENGPARH